MRKLTAVRAPKPKARTEPHCQICGDTGLVPRAYVEPELGLPYAMHKVPCPKCGTKQQVLSANFLGGV